ncbi:alpha/beta hydrolase fold domain-containing protein [Jiulongibacter sp. NS-SX5]|uniref:alpha/beta hydrolase fold domain-containing protein n=1 Tax=Jiulongibacter sp. NS-SX5 TaxID=3463854 RepID=UPI0040596A44
MAKKLLLTVISILAFMVSLSAQNKNIITPLNQSFEDFPESKASHSEMIELSPSKDEITVSYKHDVVYTQHDSGDLHLQILTPGNLGKSLPCIVYVQGSAWFKQDVYRNLPQLADFAKRGFVIAVVEYRPSTVSAFPAQLLDAKTAIKFIRKNAAEFGIDDKNIFIWGDSSGGHTALMVNLTQGINELDSETYPEFSSEVNAVVDFYGPTDISQMNYEPSIMDHIGKSTPEGMLIGGKNVHENMDLASKTNPINYISKEKKAAPTLIFHGSKDRLVPFHQSVLLADKLKSEGYQYTFYKLKEADHGSGEFWSKEVFDMVESYLREHLKH